jgi:hypothetical protein
MGLSSCSIIKPVQIDFASLISNPRQDLLYIGKREETVQQAIVFDAFHIGVMVSRISFLSQRKKGSLGPAAPREVDRLHSRS